MNKLIRAVRNDPKILLMDVPIKSAFWAVFGAEIYALAFLFDAPWNDRLSAALVVIGVSGLVVGIMNDKLRWSPIVRERLKQVTSTNLLRYIAGAIGVYALMLSYLVGTTFTTSIHNESKSARVGLVIYGFLSFIFLAYGLVHVFIVAPLAYIPVVLASGLVDRLKAALPLRLADEHAELVREVGRKLSNNEESAIAYLVGIPTLLFSILSQISGLFV